MEILQPVGCVGVCAGEWLWVLVWCVGVWACGVGGGVFCAFFVFSLSCAGVSVGFFLTLNFVFVLSF